jgi:hypothetical protein
MPIPGRDADIRMDHVEAPRSPKRQEHLPEGARRCSADE